MPMSEQAEGIRGVPTPPAGNGAATDPDPKAIQGVSADQPGPSTSAETPAGKPTPRPLKTGDV